MQATQLREVQAADRDFLFTLYAATRGEELRIGGFDEQVLAMLLPMQFEAQCQHYQRNYPDAEHAIVEGPRGPVGRWLVDRSEHEIRLVDISLLPSACSQGIGTTLLLRLQEESDHTGVPLRLNVVRGNPARRLYQRMGFADTGSDGIYNALEWRATSEHS
jgi:GNAT superfamily N-acetyltransferase